MSARKPRVVIETVTRAELDRRDAARAALLVSIADDEARTKAWNERRAARDLAARAAAADLDPTSRGALLHFDVAHDVDARRGELSITRTLQSRGLISLVGADKWRITPAGQEVASVIREDQWIASRGGRVAS